MAESPANPQSMARPSPRHLAQVKAFLSYMEDVEVDEETIEDILTGLDEEFDSSVTSDQEQSAADPDAPSRNGADGEFGEDEDEFAQEGLICHCYATWLLGVSFGRLRLAKDAWTEEEVKQIIQFLKQRGECHAVAHLKPLTLIPVRRNEGFPHGVRHCAPDPDHPPPLCIWHIAGRRVVFEFTIGAQRTAKCKELRQKWPKTQLYFLKVVIFQV